METTQPQVRSAVALSLAASRAPSAPKPLCERPVRGLCVLLQAVHDERHKECMQQTQEQQQAARFQAVIARHRERITALERDKRVLQGLPAGELQQWEARRHAAATVIQARWRGARQRQQLAHASHAVVSGVGHTSRWRAEQVHHTRLTGLTVACPHASNAGQYPAHHM
jgi:hypothetical protein